MTTTFWRGWDSNPRCPSLLLGLATLYYFAPNRPMTWRWISPGAVLATLLFLAGSVAFSQYVAHFGNYNETYGSVRAVIALLMWLYLTAYFVLVGAELNAELDKECAEVAKQGSPPAGASPGRGGIGLGTGCHCG